MKRASIYIRSSAGDGDSQREELLARLGGKYKIVGEFRDVANTTQESQDRSGLKAILDAVTKGEVEVLLCSDLTRLTQSLSLEIIGTLQKAGVQIVTADGTQIGFADLVANTLINQIPMTEAEARSQRIKRGIRAARERRKADGNSR